MSYTKFSGIYDRMIAGDVDYGKICDFIENVFDMYGINPEIVADFACGTGGVTIPMAKRGYDMIGADRSLDMLNIARSKKGSENILFLNQDIAKTDLFGTVGGALCMTDGFNYILSDSVLISALSRICTCFMDPGAVLIFDVSSLYKLKCELGNNTFVYDTDEMFYVWENRYLENKKLIEMNINFFEKKKHGYRRISEHQVQRARSCDEIKKILEISGFSDIRVFSSTEFAPYDEKASRLWFTAQKPV